MNLSPTTLCIVDMQTGFPAYKGCVREVVREVKLAIKRNAGIIILEYKNAGRTISAIRKLTDGYEHAIRVVKYEDDGSSEMLRESKSANIPTRKIRFVGVNRTACVRATVSGTKRRTKRRKIPVKVEIAINATWDEGFYEEGVRTLTKLGKIIGVPNENHS